jgi:hypothetical protein
MIKLQQLKYVKNFEKYTCKAIAFFSAVNKSETPATAQTSEYCIKHNKKGKQCSVVSKTVQGNKEYKNHQQRLHFKSRISA